MNKHEFRRAVFGIIGSLLGANGRQVPYVDSAIFGCGCEVNGRVGGPSDLEDWGGVGFERVGFGG